MKQTAPLAAYAVALLFLSIAVAFPVPGASAQTSSFPQLSMPVEHINYTVTQKNGVYWASIDGQYPIYTGGWSGDLPMVYPMPPNTTNIHVYLDSQELPHQNSSGTLHRTAVGDWQMIETTLQNISDFFQLEIHYEHPIQQVNGSSNLFLYDLNIIDYLSEQNPNSTAHFTIRFQPTIQAVHVYTAPVDSEASMWHPKTFTETFDGDMRVVLVEMTSHFGEELPGDLTVVFSRNADGEAEDFSLWVVPVGIDVALVAVVLYLKRKAIFNWLSQKRARK